MTLARGAASGRSPPFAISNHGLRASGGIERYALTLVRGLHARRIRPVFIAKAFDSRLPEVAWVDAVKLSMAGVPGKLRDAFFDWRLSRLKARRGWFPLVACNQTAAADLAICGSNHPAYVRAMGDAATFWDGRKTALEAAHLRNARIVVAHSRTLIDQAQQHYGADPLKFRLLYPPVDGERFAPVDQQRRAALRERLDLPKDRAVFLLASTGHRRKGLHELLRIFNRTALPACLVVAGRPVDDAGPNVRSLGYRNDIEDVYRAVDCTVLASHYEPFGLVGVESVLCGTPVIVAAHAGCAEVLRKPAAMPYQPDLPESLEQAIEAMVERWRDGNLSLDRPRDHLGYDPSVDHHLDMLLDWIEEVRASA